MGSETKFKETEIGKIPEDWVFEKIKEIGNLITGKTPSTKRKEYWGQGYPFVTPSDISDFNVRYAYDVERYVTKEWLKDSPNLFLPENTVCFVCIGSTIGKMCLLKEKSFTNQQINSLTVNNKNDSLFVFYLLRNNRQKIKNKYGGGGAAKDIISKSTFESIELLLPTNVEEQRAIASILGVLDDKIELNRQMNATLERIAQAIFKRWFVDFEFPNEAGKPYKSSGGEMVDSELGQIPKGWRVGKLGDFVDVNWGDTNTTKSAYIQDGFDAYSASGLDGKMNHYDYDKPGVVLSAIGAYCGQTWYASGKWSCIKNTIRILSISPEVSTEYIYFFTLGQDFWPKRGSAQPFISQTDARNIQIIIPKQKISDSFSEKISIILKKIKENQEEIKILSHIRDSLLPKLMSGED